MREEETKKIVLLHEEKEEVKSILVGEVQRDIFFLDRIHTKRGKEEEERKWCEEKLKEIGVKGMFESVKREKHGKEKKKSKKKTFFS